MAVRSLSIPWRVLVVKADPDHDKKKRDEIEYDFSDCGPGGKVFRANPENRGAYAEE